MTIYRAIDLDIIDSLSIYAKRLYLEGKIRDAQQMMMDIGVSKQEFFELVEKWETEKDNEKLQ